MANKLLVKEGFRKANSDNLANAFATVAALHLKNMSVLIFQDGGRPVLRTNRTHRLWRRFPGKIIFFG